VFVNIFDLFSLSVPAGAFFMPGWPRRKPEVSLYILYILLLEINTNPKKDYAKKGKWSGLLDYRCLTHYESINYGVHFVVHDSPKVQKSTISGNSPPESTRGGLYK